MKLYVYRVSDTQYGAGLGFDACKKLGRIVEAWTINTPTECKFVASNGTNYFGASDQVSKIADLVHDLLVIDPTFSISEPAQEIVKVIEPIIEPIKPKESLIKRILRCFYAR